MDGLDRVTIGPGVYPDISEPYVLLGIGDDYGYLSPDRARQLARELEQAATLADAQTSLVRWFEEKENLPINAGIKLMQDWSRFRRGEAVALAMLGELG